MRHILLSAALCILLAKPALAGPLTAAETEALRTEIAALVDSIEHGDAEAVVRATHPALHEFAGGEQALRDLLRTAMKQFRQMGLRILDDEVGQPTRPYAAGDEEVVFVPRESVMELQGKRMRSITYMIAIRPRAGGAWTYLDGAGLRDTPEMLHQLLPALKRSVPLPPNTVEPIE